MTSELKSMASLPTPIAHRPALAPHQQYVQWTQHHQYQAQRLPPCAVYLWQYLLYKYPGGVPQEIDLEEIRFEISLGRSKTYCVQSLKNALWKYLVPKGLVEVVKQFTKRIMRVVANHAGPVKEIEKKFEPPKFNLHSPKQIRKFEPETLINPSSIQRNSENTQTAVEGKGCDDEGLEEIKAAIAPRDEALCAIAKRSRRSRIADAPFIQEAKEQEPSPPESSKFSTPAVSIFEPLKDRAVEPPVESSFSTAVVRTILERLRTLGIPSTTQVRTLVAQTPEPQIERNISALEEEAQIKGLKSPIAAFKYFVVNNCQPCLWDRQSWWNRAALALGKERRDCLIQSVTEYLGEVVIIFTNGRRLALTQAQEMSWEAITLFGEQER